ncbi:nucleotidyl transferase AbiEii/AbiGii toxin family protein [uncultured Bacteroides sp.]|uniref:nucleotidyl transferase AbiEii/AbiGii toxin family protein n=1 Tax=uncultured Bacteroides sp. TaxID=162156 RepID=UPI002AA5E56E|nr:nucleotidyl transferase AbiEii/AbiGii toxin family protein [uncultured Bacteroides sp.]
MSSYSKSDLERIAKESGFLRDNLEKVLRLVDVLDFFNTNPVLSDNLTLKGGTAINLTVFNLPRLSVDIDLDFIKECGREEMLVSRALINQEILSYMFTQGYTLSSNTKSPHSLDSWAFFYQNAGGNKDNIKIEINYSMRNHIYPMIQVSTNVDFIPSVDIQALTPLELFGSKIKALIERTAARDLYDVYNMINKSIFSDAELVSLRKVVLFYLAVGGSNAPKTVYSFEAIDKLKYPQIRAHLIPVLRKSEHFNFEEAKVVVKNFLTKLMVLTEREKEFVEAFNAQSYCPELLFDDEAIIKRIKEHPMAIWKTRAKTISLH